jgi:hypothetical protein
VVGAIAGRLVGLPEVRAAMAEALQSRIHIIGPAMVDELETLGTTKNPQQVRAIESVLNRILPQVAPVVNVKLEYTPPTPAATAEVLRRIAALATAAGVKSLPAPTDAIDGGLRNWPPMSDPCIPPGTAFFMVAIAVAKRALADLPMRAGERLRVLEQINRAVDSHFTAEMLQLVEPASDAELAMVGEAQSLDPKERKPDAPLPPSVHLLASSIEHFAKLNLGIRSVIALYSAGRHVEAAH